MFALLTAFMCVNFMLQLMFFVIYLSHSLSADHHTVLCTLVFDWFNSDYSLMLYS